MFKIAIIAFLIPLALVAQRYKTATSYLEFVDSHHQAVVQQTWDYTLTAINTTDYSAQEGKRKVLENTLAKGLRYLEKEKPFDFTFQQAAIAYFKGNMAIITHDFASLLKEDRSKDIDVNRIKIIQDIRKKMIALRTAYDTAVQNYGVTHHINITSSQANVAVKMKRTMALYEHYYAVTLKVDQVQEKDRNLFENLQENSVATFTQHKQALGNLLTTNERELQDLDSFENDGTLLAFAKAYHQQYKQQVYNALEPVEAVVIARASTQREELDDKIEVFNKTKTALNIARRDAVQTFNAAKQAFLRKHLNSF